MTERNELQSSDLIKINEFTAKGGLALTLFGCPDSDEFVIERKLSGQNQIELIRFPKNQIDQLQLLPDQYRNVQNAIEEYNREQRVSAVFADSLESFIGYDSLHRVMGKYFGSRIAYYRSDEGGSLSLEEARKEVYRENLTDKDAMELLDSVNADAHRANQFPASSGIKRKLAEDSAEPVGNDQAGGKE